MEKAINPAPMGLDSVLDDTRMFIDPQAVAGVDGATQDEVRQQVPAI